MKKSLIFWFAAVTCAAWILVGCESPTNGDAGAAGAPGPATLPEDATPELLSAYFASTDKVFLVADLAAGTFEVPAGKTLAVVGDVELSKAPVIDAYDGTLDVALGTIDGKNTAVVIVAPAAEAAVKLKVSNASVPAYVASIPATPSGAITEDVVLPGLTIGGSGTSAADFKTFAGSAKTVYVAGDVTIDASSAVNLTGAKLVVLGRINAAGAGPLTLDSNQEGSLTATGNLTLAGVSNLAGLNTGAYTVTSTDTTVELEKLDSGAGGKLVLTGNVTAVTIGGGNGNVELSNSGALTLATASFGNTGTTTFSGAGGATFSNAATFGGTAIFSSTATFSNTADFNGDVKVTDANAITLSANAVTLAAGKSIKVGSDAVLTAGASADVVLTPGGAATLTPAANKLTLGAYDLTLTSGTLTVAAGAELALDSKDLTVTAANATLALTGAASTGGAKLTGTGKVAFGYASISGSTHGWQAVGADTSIAFSGATTAVAITGTGTSPKLVAAGETVGVITVGTSDGTTLTLANAEINVAAGGSILIKDPSSGSNILKLAGATAIIGGLTGGLANQTLASNSITNAEVDIDGTNGVQVVSGAASGAGKVKLSGKGDGSGSTITVASTESGDATIDKSTKIGSDA